MLIHPHVLTGASALAMLAASSPLLAEAPPEIVVTAQKDAEAEVARTPGGADLVEASEYRDNLAVSLRDALAYSPGVYTQPRFGQEVRLSIRGSGISRGYHMRGILLFQDGIPINLADDNGDFQELDPILFDRLEVFRGGNALRLGGSTLGGAINGITPTGDTAPGLEARIDGGSYGTARAKLAFGVRKGPGDAWFAVAGDRSDGERDHDSRHAVRFLGNVGLQVAPTVQTRFYAAYNHIQQDLPGALTRDLALTDPRTSLPANVALDQERDVDSIRFQNRTTVDLGSAQLVAGAFLNAKQLFHPINTVTDQQSTDTGVFGRFEWKGSLGAIPVEASLGTLARWGHVDARTYVNVRGNRGALTSDALQRAHTIDSYAELRIEPVAHLWLIGGAVHVDGRRSVDQRLAPARSGAADYSRLAPKAGLLWEPHAGVQVYGNYSRSIELPGFIELNQTPFAQGGTVPSGFVDLDPQRAWTAEVGTRGTAGPARWDVSLYRSEVRGELLQFAPSADVLAATFNAGRTRHQGVEASLDLQLARWALLRQAWQYGDFRFRGDAQFGNNRLPVIPKHLYRAGLRLGSDAASVTPSVEWVPQGAWADYSNTTRAPGYATIGLSGEATVRDGVTLFFDARNLANKHAIGDISATLTATSASAIYYPVERRALYGGVRARF